MSEVQV